jgi:hypothetical protein
MNKIYFTCVCLSLFSLAAHAQAPSSRNECNRRCNLTNMPPAAFVIHAEKMKAIGEKKKAESDPQKIKALESDEADEIERVNETRRKTCTEICRDNPEN